MSIIHKGSVEAVKKDRRRGELCGALLINFLWRGLLRRVSYLSGCCEWMCFCVCLSGHACVDATVSLTVGMYLSSAVEPHPRRLTAHVPSPPNLVPQLRCTMTEQKIYFNSEFKQREHISLKQLAIQLLWITKYSSYIIKSRCGFKLIGQFGFLFLSSCLHGFPPTVPNKWRSGELKVSCRCECGYV